MTKSQLGDSEKTERKTRKRKPSLALTVKVIPVEEESDIANNIFAFSYSITIENKSAVTTRLINRHWKVFSAGKQIADVKGEGVVGQQPVLKPKDSFEYSSWTVVRDPMGSMKGIFTFVTAAGEFFDLEVPEFNLVFKDRLTIH